MIHEILSAIVTDMNAYLRVKFNTREDKVLPSIIVDQDGSVVLREKDKIILSVVNITKDGTRGGGPGSDPGNMPINLAVYILFSAYFNDYMEALKFLSGVVGFFQAKGNITHFNTPGLSPEVPPLGFEVVKLSFDEMSNLWSALGAKYMPSIIFRMRSVPITDQRIRDVDPVISAIESKDI